MAVKYGKFQMPANILVEQDENNENFARFIAEPLERGYGQTVGNALRRILLNSIEVPAIVSLRIEGVSHEYAAIDGVVEDVINIILNLKNAKLRCLPNNDSDTKQREPRLISNIVEVTQAQLKKEKGSVTITLQDLFPSTEFELTNPELEIMTVTKPFKRQIDVRVAYGRGYVAAERHQLPEQLKGEILIDGVFSPVVLATYHVENTRVGQDTDYDKMILDVTTDGRVTPQEAVSFAAQIATSLFSICDNIKEHDLVFESDSDDTNNAEVELLQKLILRIDEIELSVRSTNCLSNANIETIAELVTIPEKKMLDFRNFGKKSLIEIKEKLAEMGLHLGMDLSSYNINYDNVRDRIKEISEELKLSV